MRVTLQSTTRIIELEVAGGGTCMARIWEGETSSGIRVHAYITRIAVGEGENTEQFDIELLQCKQPSAAVAAIPLRLIL